MATDTSNKVADFFAAYPLREFDKQQLLAHPEEQIKVIYYIVEGRASQYDITSSGNEVVVNIFKPGAFFPMAVALNDTPNDYFFEASTKLKVHVAPQADVVKFLQDNPEVALDLLKRVYRGVEGVLRKMVHLMSGDTRKRLIFELLNATYRFGELKPDGSVVLGLKESDLARHSGLARETVSRNLQSLKAADILSVSRLGITVKDVKALEAQLEV